MKINVSKTFLPVFLAAVWISISEYCRYEYILKSVWAAHFQRIGTRFPSAYINNFFWEVWSVMIAFLIFMLSKKFTFIQTGVLTWLTVFVMTWIIMYNLNTLPMGILIYEIPLSILEIFVAAWIIKKFKNKKAVNAVVGFQVNRLLTEETEIGHYFDKDNFIKS